MAVSADPVVVINFFLCIVILILGYYVYRKKDNVSAFLIGIAFCLFGFSHFIQLVGVTQVPEAAFIILRVCGYILVAAALYLFLTE
jgi:hypothetical protein